jgi:hypothetical protein
MHLLPGYRVRDVLAKCLSWRSAQVYICCTSDVGQLWGGWVRTSDCAHEDMNGNGPDARGFSR